MKYAEDTWFALNVFKKSKKIRLLTYEGYYYRDNQQGAMSTSTGLQQPVDVFHLQEMVYGLCKDFFRSM